jgi:Ca2+-binding EF-hand superfamily protein
VHGTISDAFTDIDADGDGRLSREELYAAMQRIGVRVSLARIERMLADMDIDQNRAVDYREFMRKTSQVPRLPRAGGPRPGRVRRIAR